MTAHSKVSDNHKPCQNFQAVLWMFFTSAALMKWQVGKCAGWLVAIFKVWRASASKMGQLEGFSLVEMAGMKKNKNKKRKRCPLQRLVQVKVMSLMTVDNESTAVLTPTPSKHEPFSVGQS